MIESQGNYTARCLTWGKLEGAIMGTIMKSQGLRVGQLVKPGLGSVFGHLQIAQEAHGG